MGLWAGGGPGTVEGGEGRELMSGFWPKVTWSFRVTLCSSSLVLK